LKPNPVAAVFCTEASLNVIAPLPFMLNGIILLPIVRLLV